MFAPLLFCAMICLQPVVMLKSFPCINITQFEHLARSLKIQVTRRLDQLHHCIANLRFDP